MTRQVGQLSDIAGILFDKDGTLLDFHATWVPKGLDLVAKLCDSDIELMARLMATVGFDEISGRVKSGSILAAGNNLDIAKAWAAQLPLSVAELEALINAEFAVGIEHPSVPVANLTSSLGQLHDMGYVMGVATMDSEQGIISTLRPYDCLHLFQFLCGYDSGHGSKPGPGMVQAFCEATRIKPHQVMVVGDNTHDLHMGLSASAGAVVGVLTGTSVSADLHQADYILDSIADLPLLLA